jgi:hypothetical protein
MDSGLVDEIGNTSSDPIKVSTRGNELTTYKLVESGADTGIFIGEVTLAGFAHDADGDGANDISGTATSLTTGSGPTEGKLATTDNDGLSVSFEFSEDETVVDWCQAWRRCQLGVVGPNGRSVRSSTELQICQLAEAFWNSAP